MSALSRLCIRRSLASAISCSPHPQATRALSALSTPPKHGVDWLSMGFGLNTKDTKMVMTTHDGSSWGELEVAPYGPLPMEPSSVALNYGQSLFEGMKAMRTIEGEVVVFRPWSNHQRLSDGASRYAMAPVPEDIFLKGLDSMINANAEWVPPHGQGALYMRPLLFGCAGQLGVGPSVSTTLLYYGSPVGGYFKKAAGGGVVPVKLRVSQDHDRAAPRGVGSTKAAGNYAPCFNAQASAKAAGFDDVLYLDALERRYIEEVAASNFFVVRDGVAHTPSLGTILPGVTRRSVIELLRDEMGMEVVEGQVDISTAMQGASEAFCVGTGASVSPIGSITNGDAVVEYSYGESGYGPVAEKVLSLLYGIQSGTLEDKRGWIYRVQAN